MALADTIATIISRSKVLEICDTLNEIQNATTEEEVIEAGLTLAVYAYQAGIIDDALLADFTESILNSYKVYSTGTYTISDPDSEVYIANAVVNITLTGSTNVKINVMGGGTLNLVAGGTSFATVCAYDNAQVTLTVNDSAMVNMSCRQNVQLSSEINNNGIFHLKGSGSSSCGVTVNNTSYALAKMFDSSSITPANYDTATLVIKLFQNAQSVLV